MNQRFRNRQIPAGNPLANLLVVVVGILTIAVSIVVGFFAFVVLAGFLLVVATVLGIRGWWLKKQLNIGGNDEVGDISPENRPTAVIEGEFKVVDDKKQRDPEA